MPLNIPNAAYDAYFDYFKACTRIDIVSNETLPTDLTGSLAHATITPGSDYTVGAGTPDGRRLTVAEKTGVDVTANGTSNHAVLSYTADGGTTWSIRLVTTCNQRILSATDGDKVNMGTFYLQVGSPTPA